MGSPFRLFIISIYGPVDSLAGPNKTIGNGLQTNRSGVNEMRLLQMHIDAVYCRY